ncbi:MAG: hypothetical protein UY35_C0002G0053 [Candidatus Saccharibacteria bacterium GW2011_GWC2_48_9]|nr:MAG: hypothetical protein UY35_C0002G0053 [Candidatus Saccharibacteria bacterium GW2011_GWC2_48_9]
MSERRLAADPASYSQLLHLIAQAESKGNYNAYFGNASNTSVKFTDMSIAEVREWQANFVREGNASSAVGRYQIIDTTLDGLVQELNLNTGQKFDETTQDKLAIALLERRGSISYINQDINTREFAANLAQEWAALPKTVGENPESSYYAGDGLNKSLVNSTQVLHAIENIRAK